MKKQELTLKLLKNTALKVMPKGSHVWLYGSRARGGAHSDSDWDILLLLDKDKGDISDYSIYAYPFVELGWQHDAAVSPQIYTLHEWNERHNSLYRQNVEHDKVVIL